MSTTLTAESVKKAISYFYLLSYCYPAHFGEIKNFFAPLRKRIAKSAKMSEAKFFKAIIPEVCTRIVAFHEDTREPSQYWVDALAKTASKADKSLEDAIAFQEAMSKVARLPQRATPDNRLHRKKGCDYCRLPCHYGFFTLVSDPDFATLQDLLDVETNRDRDTQSAIRPIWGFTSAHLIQVLGIDEGYPIIRAHLGNLSYCLLMLAMAKSRLALPEKQLQVYQAINQRII